MIKKWVVVHHSLGVPRAVYQLQKIMESNGIETKIETVISTRMTEYKLFVQEKHKDTAIQLLKQYKNKLIENE